VYFTVTVKAGVLTATAGKNAVDATGASITDKTLSSTVVPVLEVRKADYTGIVTVAAPYVASDYTVSCTSSTLSIMRTPSTSSYSITSTSQTFDLTIPAALSTGDVTISCAATDSNAAKGLISGTTLSIKLTVVGPGIQVLTGNATMANASDYGRIASGTDIAGTGDLTKTMVVPIGYAVPSGAISLRLKAPVSNPSVVITCASDTTSVMPTFTVTMSSTDSGALGNRNAIMTGSNALLTAAGTGTKDTLVTYTCASTCDNVSATIGTASFQVWVPAAGAYFLRATSSTYTARTSFIAATPTYTIYKKVDTVTILSGVSQQTQIYVYTSTAVALNMTCTSDQSTVSVSNTSTANSVSLTSNAFYTGAAATLTVKSSATANVTATITCTPQIGSGSYTTSTSFSFKVAAQPVQTLTAVAGTRNAKFVKTAPTAVTSVSIEALGVPIPGLVAIMSSDSSLTQTNAIGCTSSDATIIGDIITNSNQKATTNDATPVSPSGDFQNAVATVTSYSTETPSDYTNGFDTTKAYKYDLQLPVPKGTGTVTYTCSEYTVDSTTKAITKSYSPTVAPTTFKVTVSGAVTGDTPPPASVSVVQFSLAMVFDQPPSVDVKTAIFSLIKTQTAAQTGISQDLISVRERTSRKLMTVSGGPDWAFAALQGCSARPLCTPAPAVHSERGCQRASDQLQPDRRHHEPRGRVPAGPQPDEELRDGVRRPGQHLGTGHFGDYGPRVHRCRHARLHRWPRQLDAQVLHARADEDLHARADEDLHARADEEERRRRHPGQLRPGGAGRRCPSPLRLACGFSDCPRSTLDPSLNNIVANNH